MVSYLPFALRDVRSDGSEKRECYRCLGVGGGAGFMEV